MLELLDRTVAAAADEDERRLPYAIDSIRHVGRCQLEAAVRLVERRRPGAGGRSGRRVRGRWTTAAATPIGTPCRTSPATASPASGKSPRRPCRSPTKWPTPTRRTPTRRRDAACTSATTWSTMGCRRSRRSWAFVRRSCIASPRPSPRGQSRSTSAASLMVTLAIVVSMLQGLDLPTSAWVGLLLLLPATQAAVEFINALVPAATRPRVLPKLDFSKGIPADCAHDGRGAGAVAERAARPRAGDGPGDPVPRQSRPASPLRAPERFGGRRRSGRRGPRAARAPGRVSRRGPERALRRARPDAVLSVPSAPRLQRVGAAVDGLGAQARQAAGPESPPARRVRQLPGQGGRRWTSCPTSGT